MNEITDTGEEGFKFLNYKVIFYFEILWILNHGQLTNI